MGATDGYILPPLSDYYYAGQTPFLTVEKRKITKSVLKRGVALEIDPRVGVPEPVGPPGKGIAGMAVQRGVSPPRG